jgi:RimJ/RimL family protein N-acetyltransferase
VVGDIRGQPFTAGAILFFMVVSHQKWPPELLDAGNVRLRRHNVGDAEGITEAVVASIAELRPWMPWATEEATDVGFQRQRLESAVASWEAGSDFSYVVVDDEDRVLGVMSLMARIGPDALEIGYWLRSDFTGRGIATACVGALTKAALALPHVVAVEIHCDEANVRSAAIPRRLGYRLDRIDQDKITAPGEIGRLMIWMFPP